MVVEKARGILRIFLDDSLTSNGEQTMPKKINLTTETVMKLILNNLDKHINTTEYEGACWTKISRKYMAKVCKCTVATISHHINRLMNENILLSRPIDSLRGDRTNFYTLNALALTNKPIVKIFAPSIVKKISDIYIYNKSINKSIINLEDEKNLDEKKAYSEPKVAESPQPKTTTAQDMLRMYNEELSKNEKMRQPRARFLVAAYKLKFKSLDSWRRFLRAVKKSWYLMRDGFQLCLDWILKFKTLDRILSGGFGVSVTQTRSEEEQTRTLEDFRREQESREAWKREQQMKAEEHISSLNEDSDCLGVRRRYLEVKGAANYLNTLAKVSLATEIVNDSGGTQKELVMSTKSASEYEFERAYTGISNYWFVHQEYDVIRKIFEDSGSQNIGELRYA
jgi:hypothetical protein